jgi:phosphopantothenoylcysteine decarboxylase/phosphopantothenate--cysteine ligase
VLAVTGSIAAYKAVSLLRLLRRESATVSVVMTAGARRFVTPLTFEVLSGAHVATDLFEAHQEMLHLSLPEQAQAILIAPATANCLAKAALGLADDLLSTMLLTTQCPVIFAPAMDGDMWQHPTVVEHVATLRKRGAVIVEPEQGPLASGRLGQGRLADEQRILAAVLAAVYPRRDWSGRKLLISAGPTQEAIDPVRYISNRSSGKMGYALAEAARARGADVVLVSGPTSLPAPAGDAEGHHEPIGLERYRHHGRRGGRLSTRATVRSKNQEAAGPRDPTPTGTNRRHSQGIGRTPEQPTARRIRRRN